MTDMNPEPGQRPCTVSTFRIVAPLYELHQQTVDVKVRAGICSVHFTVVDSSSPPAWTTNNAVIKVLGDNLGSLHNTLVEVLLPGLREMMFSAPGTVPDGQRSAVNILNAVIQQYRHKVPAPQIRPIPYQHARRFDVTYFIDEATEERGGMVSAGLSPEGEPAAVPPADAEIVERIREGLRQGPLLPLWVTLQLDAAADFDAGNNLSGMAHLFISFEMFAHSIFRRLASLAGEVAAIDEFLTPPSGDPPSIYDVMKRCYQMAPSPLKKTKSKRQFDKLFSSFWRHRNDVLHGRPIELTSDLVDSARNDFVELYDWLFTAGRRGPDDGATPSA